MGMVKKTLVFMLSALLLFAGCGSSAEENDETIEIKEATEKYEENTQEKIVFKLSSILSSDMASIEAIENFSDKLKEETDGMVEIQVYPESQLGGQNEQYEAFKLGNIEMCLMSSGVVANDEGGLGIFGQPGVFSNSEQVEKFYNSDVFKEIVGNVEEEQKIKVLGLYHEGIRNMWFNDKKVEEIEDLKGVKLRVPIANSKEGMYSVYKEFGADPVQMNWNECYTGLQSGIIEGVENNVEMVVASNLIEFIDYEVETEHGYSALFLMINQKAYNRMNDEQKQMFDRLVKECNEEAYDKFKTGQAEAKRKAAEAGVVTIKLPEEDQELLHTMLMGGVSDRLKNAYSADVYEKIEKMK